MNTNDPTLQQLQYAWGRWWRIWRARRDQDGAGERTGDWVASRIVATAGVDPTVIADTAAHLDAQLRGQADMARAVGALVAALNGRDVLASPLSGRMIQAVHPDTARRDAVLLSYSSKWNGLAWYWMRDYETHLIGPADELETVTTAITDALSAPAPVPGR